MSSCINFLLFHEKNLLLNVKVCALLLITFGGFSVSCFFFGLLPSWEIIVDLY